MVRVRFHTVSRVFSGAGELLEEFQAGHTYELNDASAERWIRRGRAEAVVDTEASKPAPTPVAKAPSPVKKKK